MKFIYITDTHYGGSDHQGYRQQARYNCHAEELVDCLARWIAEEGDVSFVMHGGDIVDACTRENIRLAASLMKRLPCPVYLALGNHDLTADDSVRMWLEEAPQFFGGEVDFTLREDGVRLDVLCANWGPKPCFWNPQEPQLAWFTDEQQKRLSVTDNDLPRIVISHAQPCGLPQSQTGLDSDLHAPHAPFREFVRRKTEELQVLAWLGGHNHMTLHCPQGNAHWVTAPAFSETPFEAKIFEFSADERRLSMRTKSFANIVSFRSEYDFGKTFVQGRACDREF